MKELKDLIVNICFENDINFSNDLSENSSSDIQRFINEHKDDVDMSELQKKLDAFIKERKERRESIKSGNVMNNYRFFKKFGEKKCVISKMF